MAVPVSSSVISFLCLSTLIIVASSRTTTDRDIKKMMEDMGRNVPDRCFTPYDLEFIFSYACKVVLNGNETQCSFAWTSFRLAFGRKDPNTVTLEDYDTYFDVLPPKSRVNSAVYWSGTAVKSIVEKISEEPLISSSVNHDSSRIINIMIKDYNVTCWCGNTTAFLDTANPCPITPVVAFWEGFSSRFGESGRGVVYYIGDGNRAEGGYQKISFFAKFEFPKLNSSRINKLVVINIHSCNNQMVERCGEGTLGLLQIQAVSKYGSAGYSCEAVCGNASDGQQISSLTSDTIQIIREEQRKVTTVSFNQSTYTVSETDQSVRITLVLSNVSSVDVTVQVTNEDITAESSKYSWQGDYLSGPYTVRFPAGVTTASFGVPINDDNILEIPDEKFLLTINDLLLPKHITHGKFHTATVIIVSDEVGVSFNQSSYSINEASGQGQLVLLLTSPLSFDVTATIVESDSWVYGKYYRLATRGIDYFPGPFTVVFPAGATNASFHVLIADDEIAEPTENVFIEFDPESSYSLLKEYRIYGDCRIIIQDDDFTTVNFNQSAYSVYENDGYVQPVLVLSKPYSSDFTITIREDSGTASGGSDYNAVYNYDVTIPAGETSTSFNYQIYDDNVIEGYETFYLYIYSSLPDDNIRLGNINRTTITIVDDDITVKFNHSEYRVDESNKQVKFVLVLSSPPSSDVTVTVQDSGSVFLRGIDYFLGPFSVTFPAGVISVPFNVTLVDDDLVEPYESFTLYIDTSSLPDNVKRVYPYSVSVTIVDDDSTTIKFNQSAYSVNENSGSLQAVLILSKPYSIGFSLQVNESSISASSSSDYFIGPYSVHVSAGVTSIPFTIGIRNDNDVERNEIFNIFVDHASLPYNVILADDINSATVTILDDDSTRLSFKQPAYSVYESQKEIELQLYISKPRSTNVTVQVTDFAITATRDVDYSPRPYSVTFVAGTTVSSLYITIADDSTTEGNEQFYVTIDSATVSDDIVFGNLGGAVITIVDDDTTTVSFDNSTYSIDEYDCAIHPVLILSNPVSTDVTVKVLSTDGSADDEDDSSGPYYITLAAGMTRISFNVSILDDKILEEDENFVLTIDPSSLPCSLTTGDHDQATVTILEDEFGSCLVSTISGNVEHDHEEESTVLKFEADNRNATYVCKLDRENYKPCTSPVTWDKLSKGKHSVTVRARCSIIYSPTRMKIDFQVR